MQSNWFTSRLGMSAAGRMRLAAFLYAALLVLPGVLAASASAGAQTNFGSVEIGGSATIPITFTFASRGYGAYFSIVTQGAVGSDFTYGGYGSCNVPLYSAGSSCTFAVTFKPTFAGPRYGAAILYDHTGLPLGTVFLQGTGLGPQISFNPGVAMDITPAGLNQPSAVAVDAAGDLFIADQLERVLKVPAGGGAPVVISPTVNGTGLYFVCDLAVDGAGNLFIDDCENDRVVEVPADGGAAVAIDPTVNGEALSGPYAVAVDGADDLFIADTGNNRVVKVPAGGGNAIAIEPTVDGIGLNFPDEVKVDGAGDLFILDFYDSRIVEVPAGGGAATAIVPTADGKELSYNHGLAVDGAGDLFIADYGNNRVVEVLGNGGVAIEIDPAVNGKSLSSPFGVAVDGAGDLFVVDTDNSRIVQIQLSQPAALSYADTLVGAASASQTITVSNSGTDPLKILSVNGSGADASSFVFANNCPQVMGSGGSCTIHGHFEPQAAGPLTAAVTVTDNAGNIYGAQQSIPLSGTGLSPGSTTVSLSANSFAFGSEEVNFKTDAQTVTLTNTGTESLYIASVRVMGAGNRSFMYSTTCGLNLAPGASCSSRVRFDPLATGLATASLVFTDSGVGSPHVVSLSGTGTSSPITTVSFSAANLAFGNQTIGTESLSQSVTLTNSGGATLIISSIEVTGSGASKFEFANTCGSSVAAGASCTIHGHFAPSAAGLQAAAITITDNAIGSPQTIGLTGTGIAPVRTNFGLVDVGSSTASLITFTFSSAGTVGSIAVVTQGATGLDFTNDGTGSCTVGTAYAARATCTVGVNFKPAFPGPRYGAAILKDGSGNVLATTFISGTGVLEQIAFSTGVATAIAPAGLDLATSVAVDAAGDLFISDSLKRLLKVPANGGPAIVISPVVNGTALMSACGSAVDGAGNLFIDDCDGSRIVKVPADGGAAIVIKPKVNFHSLSGPAAIAVDGAGNLFIADSGNNRVVEVPSGGGAVIDIEPTVNGIGLNLPIGVTVDGAGDLFILDESNSRVVEVPAGGGPATAVALPTVDGKEVLYPAGLAVDAAGDLFIGDSYSNRVVEIFAYGGPAIAFNPTVNGEGLNSPNGVALDGAGDLFIADLYNSRIVKIQLSQPAALTYPDTVVGAESAPQTLTVSNSGNDPLNNLSVNVTGADASSFVFSNNCPSMIVNGGSCTIVGHFAPQAAGPQTTAVTITDNATGSPQTIDLTGTGTIP